MSIIFGQLTESASKLRAAGIEDLGERTSLYSSGEMSVLCAERVAMGFQPFHTNPEATSDIQPLQDGDGNLLTFDGRLDNRTQLTHELGLIQNETTDSAIVLRAFLRWQDGCFARLVGDWALALWSERSRVLYLARDHAGTRTLYYRRQAGSLSWSTYLDSLLSAGTDLSRDYTVRYLASRPLGNLTPYENILGVRPGHYVRIRDREIVERPHWQAVTGRTVRYKSDSEYEEHFRALLEQSVSRRTEPGTPIVAELSGGMDSSSIVCVSDHVRRSSDPHSRLLDTVSYFDDSEPSLNDAEYYTLVEAYRGKSGIHINTAISQRTFEPFAEDDPMYPVPGADASFLKREQTFQQALWRKGYRCVLSGVGGDEFLGGVPNHLPELSQYLVSGCLGSLVERTFKWCLAERTTPRGYAGRYHPLHQKALWAVAFWATVDSSLADSPLEQFRGCRSSLVRAAEQVSG